MQLVHGCALVADPDMVVEPQRRAFGIPRSGDVTQLVEENSIEASSGEEKQNSEWGICPRNARPKFFQNLL